MHGVVAYVRRPVFVVLGPARADGVRYDRSSIRGDAPFGEARARWGACAVHLLLCDDHLLFLDVLGPALEAQSHTVEVATTIEDALVLAGRRRPDLCVMDMRFPRASGIDGVRRLRQLYDDVKIVMLTAVDDPAELGEALAAGAVGLAYKARPLEETVRTLERVSGGEAVIDARVLHGLVGERAVSPEERLASFLTAREREVLGCLVQGLSTGEIASLMGVSHSTARTHIQSILSKLGVHSRLEAAAFAVRHHIIDPPSGEGIPRPASGRRRNGLSRG
jgi:two-component system, NarL family, nitrate/nitrite response regulator NarL